MALRHLFQRLTPRLDARWLIGLVVVLAIAGALSFIQRGGAPPLYLLALGPEGRFQDTVAIPAAWGDTATHTAEAVARYPLILAVRNAGREPVRPGRLDLSLPLRYRLTAAAGEELESTTDAGSPLITYTLDPALGPVQPGRLPAMLPAHDTLWLEVVIPAYYCVAIGDSIPDFVPAPPPPIETLREVRIFYSFEGGDLRQRRTGTLALTLDSALMAIELPPQPPAFPMVARPDLGEPDLGSLLYVGSRASRCGEPEDPMELLSTVWETPSGGRFIALDYGGVVRKRLYDLNGDGVIERESWDPDGDGTFEATREARLPIPEFLLPLSSADGYDMAALDTLPPDSLVRLDPFRRAMPGPGPLPAAAGDTAAPGTARAAAGLQAVPDEDLPEPRIRPAGPIGTPVRVQPPRRPPPDTGGGGGA